MGSPVYAGCLFSVSQRKVKLSFSNSARHDKGYLKPPSWLFQVAFIDKKLIKINC